MLLQRKAKDMAPGEAMATLFCRRCRIFGCMTHPNEHAPLCAHSLMRCVHLQMHSSRSACSDSQTDM